MKYTAGKPESKQFYVEEGDYKLKVIGASDEKSGAGNDMIKLHLRVIKADGTEGPALFDYLVFAANSKWKIDSFLASCERLPEEGVEVDLDPDELIGLECEAHLRVEEYDGRKNNKVAAYLFDDSF